MTTSGASACPLSVPPFVPLRSDVALAPRRRRRRARCLFVRSCGAVAVVRDGTGEERTADRHPGDERNHDQHTEERTVAKQLLHGNELLKR